MSRKKMKNRVTYSDLPRDVLEKISKVFDTETDFLRFRAVCQSWRSSAGTSFAKSTSLNLMKLPIPLDDDESVPLKMKDGYHLILIERIVYRVQSPKPNNPNSLVIKTESTGDGKLRLVNPLNDRRIKILPETLIPKVVNTLNFRVFEVCRSHTLHYVKPSHTEYYYDEDPYFKKVAVYANSESNDFIVMAIDYRNDLSYIKSGDEKWTRLDNGFEWVSNFCDVMYYKGQFHVVDLLGAVWVFDSNFERTKVTCYSPRAASKRQLVELYDGELFLVEGVTDKDIWIEDRCECRFRKKPTVVEVVISRSKDGRWVETKTVNDRVIFVGEDCSFAFPSKEFKGCDGGRVFYTDEYIFFRIEKEEEVHDYGYDDYHECGGCLSDEDDVVLRRDEFVPLGRVKSKFRGWHGHNVGFYDKKSGEIGSLLRYPKYAGVFWPPPRWLK